MIDTEVIAPNRAGATGTRNDEPAGQPLALYVHWPFCVSKCPYCDFNSHVRETIDQDRWRDALLRDLAYEARRMSGSTLGSIFFGGGTPSLMPPETVAAVIDAAAGHWPVADTIEITLEANPSSVEAARFGALRRAGVDRLSLGIQSFDDARLRFLGRAHDAAEALAALAVAQRSFDRVSFDLIYALPGQSEEDWHRELSDALGFGTEHLSLYQLTIEPGTRFAAMAAKGALIPMDADRAAGLYELTQELAGRAGLPAYEISNHARSGAESRHNLAYWRYQPYAGIGPGAHGRRLGVATQRHRKPENWLAAVHSNGSGIGEETSLSPVDQALEALLMGLRLREGIDLRSIAALAGAGDPAIIDLRAMDRMEQRGLVERTGPILRVTDAGALLLDGILREITAAAFGDQGPDPNRSV